MELTEDENVQKYATQCKHWSRNMLLLYEIERSCVVCGWNIIRRKNELSKNSGKK